MNEVEKLEKEAQVEEFGVVSEDTHGGFIGHTYDGGFGLKFP